LLSGALYGLSFPPFNFTQLAWVALVPILFCAESFAVSNPGTIRRNFLLGWGASFVAHLIVFFWLWKTFVAAGVSPIVTLFCWLGLSAVVALYQGVFLVLQKLFPSRWWSATVGALIWVTFETIRTYALTGFPWALFGHTRAYDTHLIQIAHWAGAGSLSFLLVFVNISIANALLRRNRKWRPLIPAVTLLLFVWAVGALELSNADRIPRARTVRVAILQGNIDQYQKWDDAYEASIRDTYEKLLREAAVEKPDVIVWPETAVPGWYPNQEQYALWVSSMAQLSGTYNIIGAVSTRNNKSYNAAFLIGPDGRQLAHYDKQHMVPFGEYIPFGNFLRKYIPYLGQLGTFDAGTGPAIFDAGGLKLSPNICYEAMFSKLIKRSVQTPADAIVNITNDGWFLDTGAPEQHYVVNIFRAIETRTPVIRAANTGISAIIDPWGRQLLRSPMLRSSTYIGELPLGT
jgi:apolipoprotein N-acyltransferase